jgi:hypothetical protein
MVVLWPAFVAACLLEVAVFAFVDPAMLHMPDGSALPLTRTAVYSLGFFLFWGACALAAGAALWLAEGLTDDSPATAPAVSGYRR